MTVPQVEVSPSGTRRKSRGQTTRLDEIALTKKKGFRVKGALKVGLQRLVASEKSITSNDLASLRKTWVLAKKKSQASHQPVRFVVEVKPRGRSTIAMIDETTRPRAKAPDQLPAALAAARVRGRARVAEILAGPDMLSADAFAELIGTSRVTVNTKRQAHQVLGLEGARRGYRFPDWQIGPDGKPFAALPALFDHLGGSPWAVYRFLVQHHPELSGLTASDALLRGHEAQVVDVAESMARDFA